MTPEVWLSKVFKKRNILAGRPLPKLNYVIMATGIVF